MLGIQVVAFSGAALDVPLSATFGEAEGDIGRGADCTLVLADPERRISRRQVLIGWRDGRHFIRQIGSNQSVELDGVPLPLEVDHPLSAGVQIRIGPYLLRSLPAFDAREPQASRPGAFDGVLGDPAPVEAAPQPLQEIDLVVGDPTGYGARPVAPVPVTMNEAPALTLNEAFSALYSGLRLPAPEPGGQTAQQLRLIGSLLRKAIGGTLELLAARAIAKRELGASATLARPRENNPLKFAPDVDAALTHLIGPAQRGFIPPVAAVADAFGDLRAHEVAVLAGMRAALDEVLSRFNPASLEQRLAPGGMWENLLPGSREAKLWTLFSERHAELMREIEDDFDSLFGRAFREAYEIQLAELQKGDARDAAKT